MFLQNFINCSPTWRLALSSKLRRSEDQLPSLRSFFKIMQLSNEWKETLFFAHMQTKLKLNSPSCVINNSEFNKCRLDQRNGVRGAHWTLTTRGTTNLSNCPIMEISTALKGATSSFVINFFSLMESIFYDFLAFDIAFNKSFLVYTLIKTNSF